MPTETDLRAALDELADEARPLPAFSDVGRSRHGVLVPIVAVVMVLAIAGGAVWLSHGRDSRAGKSAGQPTAVAKPDCGPSVTAVVCARVIAYAHTQANSGVSRKASSPTDWPTAVTVVSVLAHPGRETQPNVGPPCTSGQLITVDVIGTFDRIGVSPPPQESGQPVKDYTVDDVVITADASTGRPCLTGAKTRENGQTQPPAGATIVYRKPAPDCGPDVSTQVCADVFADVHERIDKLVAKPAAKPGDWPSVVSLVSVLVHKGVEPDGNIGKGCTSGRLITVQVVGTSFETTTSGGGAVTAIVISADAQSGQSCLLSVSTGDGRPSPGATVVYQRV